MGGTTSTSKPAAEAPAPAPETPSKAAARFCITWAAWLAIAFYISVAVLAAAAASTAWTSPLVTD